VFAVSGRAPQLIVYNPDLKSTLFHTNYGTMGSRTRGLATLNRVSVSEVYAFLITSM